MAIKSILWAFRNSAKLLVGGLFLTSLGCALPDRHESVNQTENGILLNAEEVTQSPEVESGEVIEVAPIEVAIEIPNKVGGEGIPKVGVILGPGLAQTYTHVGVLQEFVKSRIPIDAIVGLGFSAIPALIYASNEQVFDVEWKYLKLKPDELPGKGLLTKTIQQGDISRLDGFLEETLKGIDISQTKVPFGCPVRTVFNSEVNWIDSGDAMTEIKSCLSVFPYFKPHQKSFSAVTAVQEASKWLRQKGVDIVIFVNVIEGGALLTGDAVEDEYEVQMVWNEYKTSLKAQSIGINEIIGIYTQDTGILSWEKSRDMILHGASIGRSASVRMINKYGF
jgi:hypothetical protein